MVSPNGTDLAMSDPGGPVFLSFGTNVTSITVNESVIFSAVLTGHDLVGGTLTSADGTIQYGAFASGTEKGSFSLTVSWSQINQTKPITFISSESRVFVAQFFDAAGHRSTQSKSITLTCNGKSACTGQCVDLRSDVQNCGACGSTCTGMFQGLPFRCQIGVCSVEIDSSNALSCDNVCAGVQLTCTPSCTNAATTPYAQYMDYLPSSRLFSASCANVPGSVVGATFETEHCCCK
jgi:hypothetical protein